MKKLLLILLCVPLMFSCGENNEDNETEDNLKEIIKNPCDLMSYMKEIFLKLEVIADKHANIDELDKGERKQVNNHISNIKESWTYSVKKFPSFDIGTYEDCEEWQKFYKSGYYESGYSPFDKVKDFFPDLMYELDIHINSIADEEH
jgi:hypothetical protein